jgi:hypothetical protein
MEALFDRVQDRTRSRLDISAIRIICGLKPGRTAGTACRRRRSCSRSHGTG